MAPKLKDWYEEHKGRIKAEGLRMMYYALGFGVAWFVSSELTTYKIVTNVVGLKEAGLLKFTDPHTEQEVTIKEACKIAEQMND